MANIGGYWMNASAVVHAVLVIIVSLADIATEVDSNQAAISHKCSVSEMASFQRHWNWLTQETTTAQKVTLYNGIVDYISRRHPTIADEMNNEYISHDLPLELRAYQLFTDNGLFINSYTSPGVFMSHVEHLILLQPTMMNMFIDNMQLLMEASLNVIGGVIDLREEKVTWQVCMENMMDISRGIFENFHFRASCDVEPASGDPDHPIQGHVNFTQRAAGGPTTVNVELTGFQQPNSKHAMHIHEGNTTADRCLQAGVHFNPINAEHGGPRDSIKLYSPYFVLSRHIGDLGNLEVSRDNRVISTLHDDQITLFGPNNIIGRTLVIHLLEDNMGLGGSTERGRLACCVIRQTYD